VISNEDPNPEVSGKGISQLHDAGIHVTTNICSDDGAELNRFYFKYVETKLPYIILKIAQSMDGKIGYNNQEQKWLTGDESRKLVHQMRAQCDAVLIGANTVNIDNPQLSVREVKGRNPTRIIIDGNLNISLKSKLVLTSETNQTIIFTITNSNAKKVSLLKDIGIDIIQLSSKNGRIDLKSVLNILGERKIISLFVEGGQSIFSQFVERKLFDEIIVLQAPIILGEGICAFKKEYKKRLFIRDVCKLGEDSQIVLRKI
jgi:diaminohydroxyphosphoribosylaminopyrimidine deaminase/5-amino-6-(5-phosphoribosylamino)uracil reductase